MSLKSLSGVGDKALVGSDGRAVYLFEADKGGTSACKGECADDWPPLTASGMPAAGSGVDQSLLGTIKRADGTTQVTYNGHPLYYYEGDKGPGTALGQGLSGVRREVVRAQRRGQQDRRGASDGWAPGRCAAAPRRHSRLTAVSTAAATSSPGG